MRYFSSSYLVACPLFRLYIYASQILKYFFLANIIPLEPLLELLAVQELAKGLIDTVEEIKNRGPGSMYKDLTPLG